ncbi:receptor-interacting serine/threonine-protein kinase 2-like [Amphiura filiformis]|uniref:receptor-interacting serine/threonine-protein kinase 2-like n=1 Tax=Amphiura filiformis TaxID=82378 RepID=UPI003B21B4A9
MTKVGEKVPIVRSGGILVNPTKDILKEANMMLRVASSPYFVTIMGLLKNHDGHGIIMEYFENGSLKEFQRKYMKCDCWARKVKMVQEIAFGMTYLHNLNPPIVRSDLKLEDVLVGNGFEVKIGDMGLAISRKSSLQNAGSAGTLTHMPPEAFSPRMTQPDEFVDVYSFAITTYELASGSDAWPQLENWNAPIAVWVLGGNRPNLEAIPPDAPAELIDIIRKCWVGEPKQRPIFKDILRYVTELFEDYYERGLRKADRAISEQMDLVQEADETRGTADDGMDSDPWGSLDSDPWGSLEDMSVKDKTVQ